MKKLILKGLFTLILLAVVLMLAFIIPFFFVSSYEYNDEHKAMNACDIYASSHSVECLEYESTFKNNDEAYYVVIVQSTSKFLLILKENGDYVSSVDYERYQGFVEHLDGDCYLGLYNNQAVIVNKIINGDHLDIYYYNLKFEKVFDLAGGQLYER